MLAFGYIALSQPGRPLAALNPGLHDPAILLVVAYGIRRLPYMVRSVVAGLEQTSVTFEEAAQSVGVEALPSSLVAVFELYLRETAKRLRVRPGHPTLPQGHIERKLADFAGELWQLGVRDLPFDRTRELVDEPGTSWDDSLVRALEEEGACLR